MSYTKIVPIEFNHCDPAGIVFYPRYFEMTNSVVENFFETVVNYPFARMHADGAGSGVPTVSIRCDFRAPSRLGEKVPFTLTTRGLGRSSVTFHVIAALGGETRLEADLTLVWIEKGRAAPWPVKIRDRLEAELAADGGGG